jgi:protein-tyrosine phosphatase
VRDTAEVSLTVLFVCTGNVCRSPMAELFFLACAAPGADVRVGSAGLAALVGEPIDTSAATVLAGLGFDPTRHRARQFEPELAIEADLVLTAERAQRDAVIAAAPTAHRHTFTMKEFARLLPYTGRAEPREIIRRAADLRAVYGQVPLERDDVRDGFGLDVRTVTGIAREIGRAVKDAAEALAPPPPPRRPRPYSRPRPHRPARPLPGRSNA